MLTKKKFTIILSFLTILLISLIVMNEYSIYKASELCKDVGGTPDLAKDFLAVNWSFSCDRPSVGVK
ncbi:hypothetical protein ACM26V_21300 [Salipaludibacillus sp. HK11]|uniref:hypothetical protein n=1 Tax=Salipaludibacillus sp. HK11 TaxID=3394320 RepID=UPI0039FCCACB